MESPGEEFAPLRSYALPGKGTVVLACEKCQRKQRKRAGSLKKFKKLVKAAGRAQNTRLRVVDVPCLGLCPKAGIVVLTAEQLVEGSCSIVREPVALPALVAAARAKAQALEDVKQHEQHDDEQHRTDAARAVVAP